GLTSISILANLESLRSAGDAHLTLAAFGLTVGFVIHSLLFLLLLWWGRGRARQHLAALDSVRCNFSCTQRRTQAMFDSLWFSFCPFHQERSRQILRRCDQG